MARAVTRAAAGPTAVARATVLAVCTLLLAAACSVSMRTTGETHGPSTPAPQPAGARDVGVQLFQWTWDAIAAECTTTLGPAGYGWVLTSPPQEHVTGEQWWTSYQPVSYRVESRLGSRAQFAAMVDACRAAGVDVVTDAVLNHMSGSDEPGTGWAGSPFEHYRYPGLWGPRDFHHCGNDNGDDIARYTDAAEVQTCELVNLADLDTGSPRVRDRLHAYLTDLLSLGVAGFRIDAAKHTAPADLAAVLAGLPAGTRVVSEVIRGAGEPVTPEQYLDLGDVLEFTWGKEAAGTVRGGSLDLTTALGTGTGYAPSAQAWIFVTNHDTERGADALTYADGAEYVLANVLMLATDYGRPIVYSGYAFSDTDAGPPQDAHGAVRDATCTPGDGPTTTYDDGAWVCAHRWDAIAGMVRWRDAVGAQPITSRTSVDGLVGLGRGRLGYVVVNADTVAHVQVADTGLAPGTYCDAITGGAKDRVSCRGTIVLVDADGRAAITVPAGSAVALHVGDRVGV